MREVQAAEFCFEHIGGVNVMLKSSVMRKPCLTEDLCAVWILVRDQRQVRHTRAEVLGVNTSADPWNLGNLGDLVNLGNLESMEASSSSAQR